MSITCSYEKQDILYNKVRHRLGQENLTRILWYDVGPRSKKNNQSINLDTFAPDNNQSKPPLESLVLSERYSCDEPVDIRECQINEFWDYLFSEDWSEGSSLRILKGRLQDQIVICLAHMKKVGIITHHSTYACAVNLRRKQCKRKQSVTEMDDIMTQRETILLEFAYYGPYQEDSSRNYLTMSSSSGYPESSTLPFSSSSGSILPTSVSEQRKRLLGRKLELEGTTEITKGTVVAASADNKEPRDRYTKNTHDQRLKLRRRNPQHHALILDNISSEERISIHVSQERVSRSTSGSPFGDSSTVGVQVTNTIKDRIPKFASYNTCCNPSSSEISYSFKSSFQGSRIFTRSSISRNPSGDSTFIDTVSSQTSKSSVRTAVLKDTVSYCESSTDSSVIIEAEKINLQNFLCTEKLSYLGSFKLDAQSKPESSYNEYEGEKEPPLNIEYNLGDVPARKEDKSVLLKLRRRNQKRIEERDQRKMVAKEHLKTLSNVIAWSDSKEEDFRAARTLPEKGLIFDKVPDFQEIIDILKHDKKVINLFSILNKSQTSLEKKAAEKRETIPSKPVDMGLLKGCREKENNESDEVERFEATVREILDSAESRKFCSVRLKQLKWLEKNHFPHTKLYEYLKALRETRVFPKKVKEALPPLEPDEHEDITVTREADMINKYTNITKAVSTLKKIRQRKKKKGKIHEQGNADCLGIPCVFVSSPSVDMQPVLFIRDYQPSSSESASIENVESRMLPPEPAQTRRDKRVIPKVSPMEEESSNLSSEEKDTFQEESTFNVGKLNLRYSIEQLQRKRKVNEKRDVNSWKTYCRMKTIIGAFTRGQREERGGMKTESKGKKSEMEDGLGKSRQTSKAIGRLRWFPFLTKADTKRKTPDLHPSVEKVYSIEVLQQTLLRAMKSFVVRKEIVVSDYNGETCMSITFTKPSVFQNYKKFDASK